MSKWTPERLKKDRESWEAKNNSRATNRTASTGTAAGTANTTDKWTPERIAKARESWEAKSSGQNAASPAAAARQNTGTGLGARVLAQMTGADSSHKLQLAVPQETGRTQAYPGKSGIVTDSGTGSVLCERKADQKHKGADGDLRHSGGHQHAGSGDGRRV